jgi:glyoxylate/hydroxypyruvate reductase A
MIKALFAASDADWRTYKTALNAAFAKAGLSVDLSRSHAVEEVGYIVYAPSGPLQDFSPYVNCKAVLSLWAGVERIVGNQTLTHPLARMVDPSMAQGMMEYVVAQVLRHHLGMDRYLRGQDGVWRHGEMPPVAQASPITMLGLGELGRAAGLALASLGFPVRGWSRSKRAVEGIECYHGEDGLVAALEGTRGIVLLLPATAETENILNTKTLALPAKGAFVINPGRGTLIDDAALLAAIESGQIGAATLDVFRTEPLPKDHPFWSSPNITVTPHIAAFTRPESACDVIAENIRRAEAGEPLLYLVDRDRGY